MTKIQVFGMIRDVYTVIDVGTGEIVSTDTEKDESIPCIAYLEMAV